MYFKIEQNGRIRASREAKEGWFEQIGLQYECDPARLAAVSESELRDKTDAEILADRMPEIEASMFIEAESHIARHLSPYAYALTLQRAAEGDLKAQANVAWVQAVWDDHDQRVASLASPYSIDMDFSSHGAKPHPVRDYA